jgi:hypothetical protein
MNKNLSGFQILTTSPCMHVLEEQVPFANKFGDRHRKGGQGSRNVARVEREIPCDFAASIDAVCFFIFLAIGFYAA